MEKKNLLEKVIENLPRNFKKEKFQEIVIELFSIKDSKVIEKFWEKAIEKKYIYKSTIHISERYTLSSKGRKLSKIKPKKCMLNLLIDAGIDKNFTLSTARRETGSGRLQDSTLRSYIDWGWVEEIPVGRDSLEKHFKLTQKYYDIMSKTEDEDDFVIEDKTVEIITEPELKLTKVSLGKGSYQVHADRLIANGIIQDGLEQGIFSKRSITLEKIEKLQNFVKNKETLLGIVNNDPRIMENLQELLETFIEN